MSVSEHVKNIVDQYQRITAMPEIIISENTMGQFHSFLNLLSNDHGSDFSESVLAHPDIQKIKPGIQKIFSHASSLYERHWATQILNSDMPRQTFEREYPYYQHYERATGLEINSIQSLSERTIERVLMVGSGALPVTSMALAQSGFITDNLDIHGEDLELGQSVSQRLHPSYQMSFIHNDICQESNLAKYDVIWLAALVGDEKIKANIVAHLFKNMKPASLLVVRTAYNLRTLLYPSISEQELQPFKLKLKIQTYADNFHSILIAQKPV
ncbi:nicotianamine synthase family protein [Agarilytica rhodophyticola]|uniref:nicotianamine synthase family protein n=1 Tax=Agarilytica rhodophyticola TaxID=1737490 RepID=UPI001C1FD40D|nr:nicotianamine synthase family protein [Agarilytica rhodophyticola]